jgi:hypothetical protein
MYIVQVATLLNVIGDEALEIYNTFELKTAQRKSLTVVMSEFEKYCNPKKNEIFSLYKFFQRKQHDGEKFDNFLVDLKKLIKSCKFDNNGMLLFQLVMGVENTQMRQKLFEKDDLKLDDCIKMHQSWRNNKQRKLKNQQLELE